MSAGELRRLRGQQEKIRERMKEYERELAASKSREKKAARALDRDQCLLLGRLVKQLVSKDPRLAADFIMRLDVFLKGPVHRARFGIASEEGVTTEVDLAWLSDDVDFQQRVRSELRARLAQARGASNGVASSSTATPSRPSPASDVGETSKGAGAPGARSAETSHG